MLISATQGESEHWTSKAWYKQTNCSDYMKQMAGTEHWQVRLRKIQVKAFFRSVPSKSTFAFGEDDSTTPSSETHHIIGKTENFPVDIAIFFQENKKDPAFKIQINYFRTINCYWCKKEFYFKAQAAASALHLPHAHGQCLRTTQFHRGWLEKSILEAELNLHPLDNVHQLHHLQCSAHRWCYQHSQPTI